MNWRVALTSSVMTGVFCAIFALVLSSLAPMLSTEQILVTSFTSGFFGSLVARFILKR